MASMAGSKGAFVGKDNEIARLRQLRLARRHVLASLSRETGSLHEMCEDYTGRAVNVSDGIIAEKDGHQLETVA